MQGQKLLLGYPHIALTAGSFSRYCFKIHKLFAGSAHMLVLTLEGIWVCGDNSSGQLGLGNNVSYNVLHPLNILPGKIIQVVAGNAYSLFLTTQGLFGCSDNHFGQLGLGPQPNFTILLTYIVYFLDKNKFLHY